MQKVFVFHIEILIEINHKSLTLKQINKLNGIVRKTRTHDKNIKILPHVDASPFDSSSAVLKEIENKNKNEKKENEKKFINYL